MIIKEKKSPIGKEILSIVFGVGIISGIEKLQEGGADYYVVDYGKTNAKNYLPINENKKNRFLSTEDNFLRNIKKLKTKTINKKFQSKKERQSYFNAVLGDCDLIQIVNRILEISSIDDLVINEKDKLDKLIGVLEAEASVIYKISSIESQKFISDFLVKA